MDCTGRIITAYNPITKLRQTYNAFQVKTYYRTINKNIMDYKFNRDDGLPPLNIQLTEEIEPHDPRAKNKKIWCRNKKGN